MPTTLFKASSVALTLMCILTAGLILTSRVFAEDPVTGGRYEVALWGDVPYASAGTGTATPKVPNLIAHVNAANVAFTIFDGDTKDGSSMCTDAIIGSQVRERFNSTSAPTIYTPGDNEWTDCHRTNNGGHDPLERLSYLRKTLFNTADSFGQRKLSLEHQGALGGPYSENTRWVYNNVVFATLHVVGSNNNKISADTCLASNSRRTKAQCDAGNVEYLERDAMNLAWLRRSFDVAKQLNSPGIMITIQANPGFDLPDTTSNEREAAGVDGFNNFLQTLIQETRAYSGQVVLVHGDSHYFRIDMPLLDPGRLLPNFTRVETFGSANAHWVKAIVDPSSKQVFKFEPMIVPGN
ncbi:MAG TPA: hypothetical protein VJB57_09230 [Dehalococcoidia bacterium]|nr:hypothetical protein [Dehalococcoidia bacterium]